MPSFFQRPLPLSARQQYMDLPLPRHRIAPVGMPPVAFVSCDYLQMATDVKAEVDAGGGILPNSTLSDVLSRKIRSGYAAGVTWMDQQAGQRPLASFFFLFLQKNAVRVR